MISKFSLATLFNLPFGQSNQAFSCVVPRRGVEAYTPRPISLKAEPCKPEPSTGLLLRNLN